MDNKIIHPKILDDVFLVGRWAHRKAWPTCGYCDTPAPGVFFAPATCNLCVVCARCNGKHTTIRAWHRSVCACHTPDSMIRLLRC